MSDHSEDPARRYAAGLPLVGDRPLSEPDRRWLARRLDRHRATTWAIALITALIIASSMVVADQWPRLARLLHGAPGISLVTGGAIGVIGCCLDRGWWRILALLGSGYLLGALATDLWIPTAEHPRWLTRWLTAEVLVGTTVLGLSYVGLSVARRARMFWLTPRIRADLAEGRLERFAGIVTEPRDRRLARVLAVRRRERSPTVGRPRQRVQLDVLPRSGVVVRADARRIEHWEPLYVADVAPAQPHALRVELPHGVAPSAPDPRLRLRRRSLTPDEREELSRHIGRLRRRSWIVIVLTIVVLGLVGWDLRTTEPDRALPIDAISLGWLALLVVVYVGYLRRWLAARKLEHDRRLRWVVTVHQDAEDPQTDPPSLEVLPISQLAWTEQTSPAVWRMTRL